MFKNEVNIENNDEMNKYIYFLFKINLLGPGGEQAESLYIN
jgi:hypothetical protein